MPFSEIPDDVYESSEALEERRITRRRLDPRRRLELMVPDALDTLESGQKTGKPLEQLAFAEAVLDRAGLHRKSEVISTAPQFKAEALIGPLTAIAQLFGAAIDTSALASAVKLSPERNVTSTGFAFAPVPSSPESAVASNEPPEPPLPSAPTISQSELALTSRRPYNPVLTRPVNRPVTKGEDS